MTHPEYITAESLKPLTGITHGFFTRNGGKSEGIYTSLNCGFGSDDSKDNVSDNRNKIAETLGVNGQSLLTVHQTHSNICAIAQTEWQPQNAPKADAIATNKPHLRIGILTADCAPILFADPKAGVVGAAHSGWRGALSGIASATISSMEQLGANRKDIYAVVGPTISQRSYEIGQEFFDNFIEKSPENACFFKHFPSGRHHFDLPSYVAHKLQKEDIMYIEVLDMCTVENESRFFSYRRSTHKNDPDYGRQISVIGLE